MTRIRQDKCKAAILTDIGFIYSGQQAGKDKWDNSSWIPVICFGTYELSATVMIINIKMKNQQKGSEERECYFVFSLFAVSVKS